ncbi:hypothetical protein B9Z51_07125 [Limnohabitans sp. T6-5]|nr:hypothetical protein B9Z51_07125 [Limnohabitans sp. T6-5]
MQSFGLIARKPPPPTSGEPPADPIGALLASLASERPIGYSANLARIAGDPKAGLMLSQLLYWTRVGVDVVANGGWISKTRDQWALETGLSRYEQESARVYLKKAGLIDESRSGTPARLAFRVRLPDVSQALARLLRSEPVQWSLFDVRSNAQQVKALLGKSLAFYRVYGQLTQSITSAVFLSRALATQRALIGGKHSEWFSIGLVEWTAETGLSESQIRTCKQKLCQLNLLEQALMEYPRRRYFIKVNISELSKQLIAIRLGVINHGNTAQSILGLLGKSTLSPSEKNARSANSADRIPGIESAQMADRLMVNTSAKMADRLMVNTSAKMADRMTIIRSANLADHNKKQVRSWPSGATNTGNPPSSSSLANSVNLDGGKSQLVLHPDEAQNQFEQSKPSFQSAGNLNPVGGFSQSLGMKNTALHAGARFLITNKTTPPPSSTITSESTTSAQKQSTQDGGGGGVSFDQLIWPTGSASTAIKRLVVDHPVAKSLPHDRLQLILDEVAHADANGQVRSMVTYLGSLLLKEQKGVLLLSGAYELQEARNRAAEPKHQVVQQTPSPIKSALPAFASRPAPARDPRAVALWAAILEQLPQCMPEQQIEVWLKPISVGLDQQCQKLLLCASRFKIDHIKSAYAAKIDQVMVDVLQRNPALVQVSQCQLVTSLPLPVKP